MGISIHPLAVYAPLFAGVRKQLLRGANGHRGEVLVRGGVPQQLPGGPEGRG